MTQELHYTVNLKVAAALLTLGFRLVNVSKVVREDGRESCSFWFEAQNDEGESAQAVHLWMTKDAEKLAQEQPEHPVNYIRVALSNLGEIAKTAKETIAQIAIEKNGRTAILPKTASVKLKQKAAEILG